MVTQVALLLTMKDSMLKQIVSEGRCYAMESLHRNLLLTGPIAPWRGVHARAGLLTGPLVAAEIAASKVQCKEAKRAFAAWYPQMLNSAEW